MDHGLIKAIYARGLGEAYSGTAAEMISSDLTRSNRRLCACLD